MENFEFYKNHVDAVVLYILLNKEYNIDDIKKIIDAKFFDVKLGTLYSIITRLKSKKFVSEYRTSCVDCFRRKYFKITTLGINEFNKNYSNNFTNAPKIEQSNTNTQTEITKADIINEIDFSILNDTVKENTIDDTINVTNNQASSLPKIESNNEIPKFKPNEIEIKTNSINIKPDIDYDNAINSKNEYNTILKGLFPKQTTEKVVENTTFKEEKKDEDFNDVYEMAQNLGVKINTSNDTNRYQGTSISVNLLRFHTSILLFLLVSLFYFAINYGIFEKIELIRIIKFEVVIFIIPFICLIIFLIKPHYKIKDLPKFKDVFEIALIIFIGTIIICFAYSAIKEIDYKNLTDLYYYIILPCLISLSIPVFYIIKYLLYKLDFYQSI